MSIADWVKHSIVCQGPCGKTMSYNKFRVEDMLKEFDDMQGQMACIRCHDQDYKTYVTQGTLDEFNKAAGSNFQNGDVFRAVMFQVVSEERHAQLQKAAEGEEVLDSTSIPS